MKIKKHKKFLAAIVAILLFSFAPSSLGETPKESQVFISRDNQQRKIGVDPLRERRKESSPIKNYYPEEIIVKFKTGVSEDRKNKIKTLTDVANDERKIGPKGEKNIHLFKLKSGASVEEAIDRFKSQDEVIYAEPNYLRKTFFTPSDSDFSNQWGLHNTGQTIKGTSGTPDADIDAPEGWDTEKGQSNPVTVTVIDSGIDFAHPELDSKIWQNSNEISGNNIDDDLNGYIDDINGYNWSGISQTEYTGSWKFGYNSTSQIFAQSIKGTGQRFSHIGILLQKTGNPSAGITVSVRSDLNGLNLASFTISSSEVGLLGESEIYKPLSSAITLTSGTTYYLVFKTANNNSSNYYRLFDNWGDVIPDIYRDGQEYRYSGGSPLWTGYPNDDFYFRTNPNSYSRDDNGHGTHVSGIIGAESDNGQGIAGISYGAKIMPLKAGNSSGILFSEDIIDAIYYAADNGAKVINMSFGGYYSSTLEQEAIDYARGKGVVIFAAAGNDGNTTMNYPAGYTNVIGVGATTNQDQRASFSNYNSSVDLTAPGKYIYSTMPTYSVSMNSLGYSQNYDYVSGTSMASPHTAGLAALIISQNPALTPLEIEQAMQNNADDLGVVGRDDYFGYGRINAYESLKSLLTVSGLSYSPHPYNPTAGLASISYTLSKSANIWLIILDLYGNLVRVAGPFSGNSGVNNVSWDGRDNAGNLAAQSWYYYVIYADDGISTNYQADIMWVNYGSSLTIANPSVSPNPFSPSTGETVTISANFSRNAFASVAIFDLNENLIINLPLEFRVQGINEWVWNGRDGSNSLVSPGTYLYFIYGVDSGNNFVYEIGPVVVD
ncbi:MAG: S8 family serine peptidase [Actinobacteria bacterium]|nr:S8 family serine peptidase [Actinomycetota bacterium]